MEKKANPESMVSADHCDDKLMLRETDGKHILNVVDNITRPFNTLRLGWSG